MNFKTAVVAALLVAPLHAQTYAYITNRGDDTISVIDTTTNTIIDTIPAAADPVGVAFHPNGDVVYVTNFIGNSVSVIDLSTNTIIDSIAVSKPVAIAVRPDGSRVYVAGLFSSLLSVIDTTTNSVIDTVSVGSYPDGIAVHPAGSFVYVANGISNTVSVINTATNTVTDTIPVGDSPHSIAVNPINQEAYVTNSVDDTVSVLNLTLNATIGEPIPVGADPTGISVHPNGHAVYVANFGSNSVSVLNVSSRSVVSTIPVSGTSPLGIEVHPGGHLVYVTTQNSDTVSIIDTLSNSEVDTIAVGSFPQALGQFIGPRWKISFPLPGETPFGASISAVFDHSMPEPNCPDGIVSAYTGEEGRQEFGKSVWSTPATGSACPGATLYGYPNGPASGRSKFSINCQNVTTLSAPDDGLDILFYDGHTGYDYPAANGTAVLAAASGTVIEPIGGPNGQVVIDHMNGYTTFYLHLSTINVTPEQSVIVGQKIGEVGLGHLHFTVKRQGIRVDPYGWVGEDIDPYTATVNVNLWEAGRPGSCLFSDGFEANNTCGWSATVPIDTCSREEMSFF